MAYFLINLQLNSIHETSYYNEITFQRVLRKSKTCTMPKNDYVIYNKINQELYGAMNGALMGQEVENMVKKLRKTRTLAWLPVIIKMKFSQRI